VSEATFADDTPVLDAAACTCRRNDTGGLDIEIRDGDSFLDVHLIPTFPLSRRRKMVAVRDRDGEEVALIDDVARLNADSRQVAEEELERAYFMPRITEILEAEEELNVLTLECETDRGPRTVQIRNARRSIRKLPHNRVVIRDVDGNRYEIRNLDALSLYARNALTQYI
jgi:hypothetical protein